MIGVEMAENEEQIGTVVQAGSDVKIEPVVKKTRGRPKIAKIELGFFGKFYPTFEDASKSEEFNAPPPEDFINKRQKLSWFCNNIIFYYHKKRRYILVVGIDIYSTRGFRVWRDIMTLKEVRNEIRIKQDRYRKEQQEKDNKTAVS